MNKKELEKMDNILNKLASILAFIIGGMAVFSGGKTLLGMPPGWKVLNWLPLYNYTAGILTVFLVAVLIWVSSRLAWPAVIGMFSLHALVMLILQTSFSDMVAAESIQAMTIRLVTWMVILGLMLAQSRLSKKEQPLKGGVAGRKV
jgi:hypothetical protein